MSLTTETAASFLGLSAEAYEGLTDSVVFYLLDEWDPPTATARKIALRLALRALQSPRSARLHDARTWLLRDWLVRTCASLCLDEAGLASEAHVLRGLSALRADNTPSGPTVRLRRDAALLSVVRRMASLRQALESIVAYPEFDEVVDDAGQALAFYAAREAVNARGPWDGVSADLHEVVQRAIGLAIKKRGSGRFLVARVVPTLLALIARMIDAAEP